MEKYILRLTRVQIKCKMVLLYKQCWYKGDSKTVESSQLTLKCSKTSQLIIVATANPDKEVIDKKTLGMFS